MDLKKLSQKQVVALSFEFEECGGADDLEILLGETKVVARQPNEAEDHEYITTAWLEGAKLTLEPEGIRVAVERDGDITVTIYEWDA